MYGETEESELGPVIVYPSCRDVAERYKVSHSLIAKEMGRSGAVSVVREEHLF